MKEDDLCQDYKKVRVYENFVPYCKKILRFLNNIIKNIDSLLLQEYIKKEEILKNLNDFKNFLDQEIKNDKKIDELWKKDVSKCTSDFFDQFIEFVNKKECHKLNKDELKSIFLEFKRIFSERYNYFVVDKFESLKRFWNK